MRGLFGTQYTIKTDIAPTVEGAAENNSEDYQPF